MTETTKDPDRYVLRWVVIVLAVLAVWALLAWDRGEPGVGDRTPDHEDGMALIVEG